MNTQSFGFARGGIFFLFLSFALVVAFSPVVVRADDATPPTIISVSTVKPNGSYKAGATIIIKVNFSEAASSTDTLTVTLETGATDETCSIPAFTDKTTISCDPSYTVQAGDTSSDLSVNSVSGGGTITDAAGNQMVDFSIPAGQNISDSSNIVIDTTVPVISSVSYSPTTGTLKIGDTITLTINADAVGHIIDAITVNGVAVSGFTSAGGVVYTAVYTVASGNTDRADSDQIPISVSLKDAAANFSATFTTAPTADSSPAIDANAPAVDITSPAVDGTFTSDTTPAFEFTTGDSSSIECDVDAGGFTSCSSPFTTDVLAGGSHTVTVRGTDIAGNQTTASRQLTVDTTPPTVGIVVADSALKAGETSLVTFTFSEPVTGFENSDITIANGALTNVSSSDGGTVWTATLTPLADTEVANNLITVNKTGVADSVGNLGVGETDSNNYAIDTLRPAAPVITTPASPLSTNANTVAIIGTAEANSTVAIAGGSAPASGTADGSGNFDIVVTLTHNTTNTLSVTVADAAGNISDASTIAVTHDDTAPIGTIEINGGAAYASSTSVTLAISASDSSGVSQMKVYNGTNPGIAEWEAFATAKLWTIPSNNASHDVSIRFKDTVGNENISRAAFDSITLDDIAPVVLQVASVVTPFNDATPDYSYSTDEAGTSAFGNDCSATAGGAVGTGAHTATFATLGDGTHSNCTVTVTDAAGNASNALAVPPFIIDTAAPTATVITSDADSKVKSGVNATITATFNESVKDAPAPTMTVSGAATDGPVAMNKTDATHYTYTYTAGSGNGTVTFTVAGAVDLTSNAQAVAGTVTLTLDNIAPVITVPSNMTAEATSASGAAVSYTAPSAVDAVDGSVAPLCNKNSGDIFPLGDTTVTCNASDTAGNSSSPSTFTVTVHDTTGPVIAAHSTVTTEATSGAGALVLYTSPSTTDDVDGASTASCLPASGTVFTVGNTTVTCTKTDTHGNAAAPATFTVAVTDLTPPTITLNGTTPDVEINTAYSEQGATATDIVDGTFAATPSGSVNTSIVGDYVITYTATDLHGNAAAPVTRTVHVKDSVADAFSVISSTLVAQNIANNLNTVTTNNVTSFSGLYLEKSIEGVPKGRLTFSGALNLSLSETTIFLQNLGTKLEQGNGSIAFDARTSAVFSATGASIVLYGLPAGITSGKLIVRDDTGTIIASSSVTSGFSQNPGTGDVTFTAAHFTKFDIDTTAPIIAAHADATVEATGATGAAVTYTPPDATDNIDTTTAATCTPASGSTFAVGDTMVTCNKSDTAGNAATPTTFVVQVVDTTVPVVTLSGSASTSVALDNTYVEPGSSATDIVDGSITPVVTGTVDTNTAGTYTLTYTATDAAGNHSAKIRDVSVSGSSLSVATSDNGNGTESGTFTNAATSSATSNGVSVDVQMPANITVTGPTSWNGTLTLPVATIVSLDSINSPGLANHVTSAIAIGAGDTALTFDKGVRLFFVGKAGSLTGWTRGGVFTEITAACADDSQTTGNSLAVGADCKISVGADLVVWTKHFTDFVTYTQDANPPAGSGGNGSGGNGAPTGGGGGGGSSYTATPGTGIGTGTGSTGGEVLGATAFKFSRNLAIGSRGGDVVALQQILITAGFLKIKVPTGYYGSLTFAAVKKYQATHGIAQVGVVGPITRASLNK